jgi:hypothetical protein
MRRSAIFDWNLACQSSAKLKAIDTYIRSFFVFTHIPENKIARREATTINKNINLQSTPGISNCI